MQKSHNNNVLLDIKEESEIIEEKTSSQDTEMEVKTELDVFDEPLQDHNSDWNIKEEINVSDESVVNENIDLHNNKELTSIYDKSQLFNYTKKSCAATQKICKKQRLYKCSHCNTNFTQTKELIIHQRAHLSVHIQRLDPQIVTEIYTQEKTYQYNQFNKTSLHKHTHLLFLPTNNLKK